MKSQGKKIEEAVNATKTAEATRVDEAAHDMITFIDERGKKYLFVFGCLHYLKLLHHELKFYECP